MKRHTKQLTHPGELLREDILEANGLTISRAAELLDITRVTLSRVVNEKAAITPNLALRLADVFGGNAEFWLRMQLAYDLKEAEKLFKSNPPKTQKFAHA